jgi:hypothetical protein
MSDVRSKEEIEGMLNEINEFLKMISRGEERKYLEGFVNGLYYALGKRDDA